MLGGGRFVCFGLGVLLFHLLRIKELQEIYELGLTASLKLLLVRDLLPYSMWQFSEVSSAHLKTFESGMDSQSWPHRPVQRQ